MSIFFRSSLLLLLASSLVWVAGCSKTPSSAPQEEGQVKAGAKKTPEHPADKVKVKAADKIQVKEVAGAKEVPAVQIDKAGEDVDFARIRSEPEKFRERVVRCKVLLSPLPMEVRSFGQGGPKDMLPAQIDDRWTTVFCRTHKEGMDSVPVQLYFAKGQKGNLLNIDREAVINVEVRGRYANQVVGLFRGIVESATEQAFFNPDAPDLVSALLWPDRYVGKKLRCINKLAVTPQEVAAHDAKAVAMVRDHVAQKKGTLHCEDRRGVSVSVALFLPVKKMKALLKIGASTEVRFVCKGFYNNQLVGMFDSVVSGALQGSAGEGARGILLDPKPWIGKTIDCETIVAPQPAPIREIDKVEVALFKNKLDDVKTSLMCSQKAGGSVGASVYFSVGKKDALLTIGGETRVKLQIQGVRNNRLVALFKQVVSGGVVTKDPKDMRAVALRPDKHKGKRLVCLVVLKPYVAPVAYLGEDKEVMLKDLKLGKKNAVLTCKDASSEIDGTRIELYFEAKQAAAVDGLKKGDAVPFKLLGAAYGTLVGLYAGK